MYTNKFEILGDDYLRLKSFKINNKLPLDLIDIIITTQITNLYLRFLSINLVFDEINLLFFVKSS